MSRVFVLIFFLIFPSFFLQADNVSTSDKGFLEAVDGQLVLHLKGNPYELGFQHGQLLKEKIAHNIERFIDRQPLADGHTDDHSERTREFVKQIPQMLKFIPENFMTEMHGIADGSGVAFEKILMLNLFPEMFHCTGMTIKGNGTVQQQLFHVRVLDYAIGKNLQDTAVLMVVEPKAGHTFLNVSYAGFIGSITGMNAQKIAIGEIGGKGYGLWEGVPMAFILRTILEKASSLDEVKDYLKKIPRTCEYYYVFSDGKTQESLGVYATPKELEFIHPGEMLTTHEGSPLTKSSLSQDCLLITRCDKYNPLLTRLEKVYGHIGVAELQAAIKYPVAQESNLHNAIFSPSSLEVWISHAGENGEPAYDQPYHYFRLNSPSM